MLWLSIPEETVKAIYERDTTPDPSTYYAKGVEDKYTGTQSSPFHCYTIALLLEKDEPASGVHLARSERAT